MYPWLKPHPHPMKALPSAGVSATTGGGGGPRDEAPPPLPPPVAPPPPWEWGVMDQIYSEWVGIKPGLERRNWAMGQLTDLFRAKVNSHNHEDDASEDGNRCEAPGSRPRSS